MSNAMITKVEVEAAMLELQKHKPFHISHTAMAACLDAAKIHSPDILAALRSLTDEERLQIFANFCKYCGCDDPKCQCWNDE